MNIIFKTVTTKNFMSFREMTFDFNSFCGQNVLIYGINDDIKGDSTRSNGSGKSTIMNTLVFALYGDILNSVKMGHIRNWNSSPKEDVHVSLELQSNGIDYMISRTLKGKKGEQELRVFNKNDGDWNEITLSTISETQRMIENDIVLCGKDGFLRCVLLTADQNYNFFKLNKSAKNQFFESLFELTVYSDMYTRLHRRTLDESALLTASSRTIDSLNENISNLERQREEERKNKSDIKAARLDVENAKMELKKFLSSNDVENVILSIDKSISDKRNESRRMVEEAISKYDSEHGICSVDSNGYIVFDDSDIEKAVSAAISEFDSKNNIVLDSKGNIVFEDSPEYTAFVEKGKELKGRIEKGESLVENLEKEIFDNESIGRKLNDDVDSCKRRIENMKMTLRTHSNITDILCSDCLLKYKTSVNIQDFDERIDALEKQISDDVEHISAIDAILKEKRPTLNKFKSGIEVLNRSLLEMRQKAGEILAERKILQKERESCIRNAENEVRMANREKQTYRDSFVSSTRLRSEQEVRDFIDKQNNRKNTLLAQRDSLMKRVSDAEYRLKILTENADKNFDAPIRTLGESLEKTKSDFAMQTKNLAHYKALEEILKPDNIRKSVVGDMLKELNFRICGYLSKMGSNYTCKFDENFDATFVSSAGIETEYNNFSSGEKMRLGIACCLAFRDFMQVRLNLHPNILAIDEYIDSNLDPMAVNGIMDMIHYMVGTEKIAAFIISHRSEVMQDMFDSEILIRKKNNESKIIVNGMPIEDVH